MRDGAAHEWGTRAVWSGRALTGTGQEAVGAGVAERDVGVEEGGEGDPGGVGVEAGGGGGVDLAGRGDVGGDEGFEEDDVGEGAVGAVASEEEPGPGDVRGELG